MSSLKEDKLLDARGLMCPMPVVKAGKEMRAMAPGEVLKILATDRGSIADVPAWASDAGHELLDWQDEGGTLVFYVRRGAEL
jgi:TusA-related sulfurtransferase